jgi:hypothetical protein
MRETRRGELALQKMRKANTSKPRDRTVFPSTFRVKTSSELTTEGKEKVGLVRKGRMLGTGAALPPKASSHTLCPLTQSH